MALGADDEAGICCMGGYAEVLPKGSVLNKEVFDVGAAWVP